MNSGQNLFYGESIKKEQKPGFGKVQKLKYQGFEMF